MSIPFLKKIKKIFAKKEIWQKKVENIVVMRDFVKLNFYSLLGLAWSYLFWGAKKAEKPCKKVKAAPRFEQKKG